MFQTPYMAVICYIHDTKTSTTLNNCISSIRTNDVVLVVDDTNKFCAGLRRHLPLTEDPSLHVGIEVITIHGWCGAMIILYTNRGTVLSHQRKHLPKFKGSISWLCQKWLTYPALLLRDSGKKSNTCLCVHMMHAVRSTITKFNVQECM